MQHNDLMFHWHTMRFRDQARLNDSVPSDLKPYMEFGAMEMYIFCELEYLFHPLIENEDSQYNLFSGFLFQLSSQMEVMKTSNSNLSN